MATRNFWGWGNTEGAFNEAQKTNLKALMQMQLGATPTPVATPELADLDMPAAAFQAPKSLSSCMTDDPFERANHTYGKAFRDIVRGLAGDYRAAPDQVAFPRNEQDLSDIMSWAADNRAAVIPYGGGSSVTGGVEARLDSNYQGAISVDMRHFDQLLNVDKTSRTAEFQGGIYGPALEQALKPHGYSLRHYPQSFEFSTLGGWIATRSGGHYATLHTHIEDFVQSVRMLTPQGIMESRRLPGSGAGPSTDRLIAGSEGIFGFITSAWMRVQERPRFRAKMSVQFTDFYQGAEAARLLSQSGLYPSNCRLIDAQEAMNNGIGNGKKHLLLVGFESADHALAPWLERAAEICRDCGGEVRFDERKPKQGAGASDDWRNQFIQAPYMRDALVTLGMVAETFETAITWDRFPEFHQGIMAAVKNAAKEVCGQCMVTCRFTHVYPDGPAPYYTVIAPGKAGSQLQQWDEIKQAASDAIIRLGGTITHHHSVGRDHQPWYEQQRADLFGASLAAVKQRLDPEHILNPGVLLR
ncbi:MAG: FAD-binding oxidoreductase [Halomonadaceae bacterium]|nr:MAG: FAD-binding oxidoreductase [Halomonadaceae bacterium]